MLTYELPSWFVMETGWDKLVAATASVYNRPPPEERSRTGILEKRRILWRPATQHQFVCVSARV